MDQKHLHLGLHCHGGQVGEGNPTSSKKLENLRLHISKVKNNNNEYHFRWIHPGLYHPNLTIILNFKDNLCPKICSTLPWSSKIVPYNRPQQQASGCGDERPTPSLSLQKTRSSPSIFAMSTKSGLNPDFFNNSIPVNHYNSSKPTAAHQTSVATKDSLNNLAEEITHYYSTIPDKKTTVNQQQQQKQKQESPSVLRRSLTMQYDCDWTKSSTMPHKLNRLKIP
jgi:hypothetical protein